MSLLPIDNIPAFKIKFEDKLFDLYKEYPLFYSFIEKIQKHGKVFFIGGFLRSIDTETKPRDIDIIAETSNSALNNIIHNYFTGFIQNRLGGYKIQIDDLTLDIWDYKSNWVINESLTNRPVALENIAVGTFYNFDSLVAQLLPLEFYFDIYNECIKSNKLDIILKDWDYSRRNPTKEANYIRAIYLSKFYNLNLSSSVKKYLKINYKTLEYYYSSALDRLLWYLGTDEKYKNSIKKEDIDCFIEFLQNDSLKKYSKSFYLMDQLNLFDFNQVDSIYY